MQTFHPPSDGRGNGRSACDRCRRHKLRCERSSNSAKCRRCSKANVECVTGAALRSGRPPLNRQPSDALETWHLHQTLQTPSDAPEADSNTSREMELPAAPITVDGLENGWPDGLQQNLDPSQAFQPLRDTHQPVYSQINPEGDCLKRLGDLQKEILVDLELVKACKTATDCAQLSLPPELAYNSSFLVGRMLANSKTLLDILDSFRSISPAPTCSPDANAVQTCTGSLRCDVPTMFSLFSSYICLIRIYRTIFSCIHDSMPVLLSLQHPVPQLFPGINLAGFTLETRIDLQIQILVQVSEDMLAKLEAGFGVSEGPAAGQAIFEPTRTARMLSMMLEEEAHEQPPLKRSMLKVQNKETLKAELRNIYIIFGWIESTTQNNPPGNPRSSFTGKTVLITGANVGLGLEAAVKFAALGASRLILGVRSIQRGEKAKEQICRRSGYKSADIQLYQLDMSSFESVKSFAKQVCADEPRLDVAVLNAGMAASSYQRSPEGFEMSLQVNTLSTALLAVLLYPKLRKSAGMSGESSHLEFVGSVGHRMVKPDALDAALGSSSRVLDLVNEKGFFDVEQQYCTTKLLLLHVMDGLVAAAASSPYTSPKDPEVIITTCCPNLCRTNLGRDFSLLLKLPTYLFQLVFARSAEEGSRILVSGTTLGKDAQGQFWSHDCFDKKGELATSPKGKALQKKVWSEIVEILKEHVPQSEEYLLQC
ncbi:uncharacterized protein Z520_06026 [Fonsecaea multimorphosa CBS 102226]|uniref:Zn(2)-C6 fungal-type domain-containing protein n=1 Tax=Fonsecaea multimorphosa CBS 102226 TaxID=1442371 RepID=A0A0D2KMQ8_9EURO|nr:uncharacterized protein Z520_06026 [Fonsecaea multimorphosa CBS 102226]KIX97948.1 hypothetical protein Z520_06026 [Fonsecaea multimorphosa CBS 102226]